MRNKTQNVRKKKGGVRQHHNQGTNRSVRGRGGGEQKPHGSHWGQKFKKKGNLGEGKGTGGGPRSAQ